MYEELEKHNETLKAELRSTSQREQDLKKIFENYMVQVQSLMNQKAIEVSGTKNRGVDFGEYNYNSTNG